MSVGIDEVRAAADRIRPYASRTPVLRSTFFDERLGARVFFKCENFQKVGAFKFRGACNAVLSLSPEDRARGVVTHSSGNHAQALALAARLRGVIAHVVMPSSTPRVKSDAVKGYGARITFCEPTLAARERTVEQIIDRTGAVLVHPYDDLRIIAGQGTAALELLEEVDDLDLLLAPVGGGGLMSGTLIACSALSPSTAVFGAEPAGADDARRSLAAGELIPSVDPDTIADGLLTSLGRHTWPIIRDRIAGIAAVDDRAIIEAMRLVWERMKIIIEPSAAVPLAALLEDRVPCRGKRVGLIVSGGNASLDSLPWAGAPT